MKVVFLRWLFPTVVAALALSLVEGRVLAQDPQQPINEKPVEMPVYTVTDTRELPPPEKWNYARIEGFEVLSNASEKGTLRLVRDFQRYSQAIGFVWPGVQRPSAVPAMLIICGKGGKFDQFMPAGERLPDRAMASLSLRNKEQAAIVIDYEAKLINLVTPEGTAATTAASIAAAAAGPDAATGPGGDPGFEVDAYQQLYREYIRFLLASVQPRSPAWFEEGIAQLFQRMEFDKTSIVVGKLDDPNAISVTQAALDAAGNGGVAPQEDLTFNAALAKRGLLKMEEIFAVTHDSDVARNPLGSTWAKQSAAFVHWGLYGDQGKNQKQFVTFISRIAREPLTEALFKECFKQSYKDMVMTLRGYIEFTNYKIAGLQTKKGEKLPEPPPVTLREATEAEIGRIKGEALLLAGHKAAARLAMIAPYIRGERDPQLVASIGLVERVLGDDAKARKFLEAAVGAKAVRPRAYLELARLRYAEGLAKPLAEGKLDANQTAAVLTPLFTARTQPPPLPEVYELVADAWLHCVLAPAAGHLAVIDEGVRMFPRNTHLVYADASLKAKAGLVADAHALVGLGLRVAPDDDTRAKFEKLKAALPPAPAPAGAPQK
ncbi:MAG: hypothetical protein HZA93_12620 [Verrucomicrobia bacterium]|nr:hypothetical protein [Verrucomicrobiota bacterium]